MKKSLFALAAVGAFAGAAQAQSSVTVYGLVDGGIGVTNIEYNTNAKQSQTTIGGFQSVNGTGNLSGSRLGFRGTEDLGSGNRAGFVLETAVNYNNATSPTTAAAMTDVAGAANGTALFASVRQAFISFGKTGFGELRIGTQNTLAKDTTEAFDPQGGPNITGSGSLYQQGLVTRMSQVLTYQTPVMEGISARIQTAVDGTASNNGGSTAANGVPTSNRMSAVSIDFTKGKIKAGAVYERRTTWFQGVGSATAGATGGAGSTANQMVPIGAGGTVNQVVPNINYWSAGASYDFGVIKPTALYYNQQVNGAANAGSGSTSGYLLGFTFPITPAASFTASYTDGKVQNNSQPLYDTTGVQLVAQYNLSKRTNIYGAFGTTDWKTNQSATTASVQYQQYAIGMRHTF